MKKIFKWLGIFVGSIILLIIIASVAVMFIVDEEMIATQMESALNRHVVIGEINVGIFSVVSGIEVKDVKISDFKTARQLKFLKGKPVKKRDLFVGLKAFNFKVKFIPLLSGKFVLKELVLYEPTINVVKKKNGKFNFDDLLSPKPGDAKKEKGQKKKPVKKAKKGKQKPFTADDLPIEITIGKVGIENGQMKYVDKGLGQTFKVYDLTALIYSIDIDPQDLDSGDSASIEVTMGVKTLGKMKSGSVKSFDIGFDIEGDIIPFDKKTRIADPEISLKAGLPYGTMTGLQIFEKMKSVEALSKFCGKLKFLKKDIRWKNAYVSVWYKGGTVKLKDGKIPTDDYMLAYAGRTNINTKAVNLELDMLLADKHEKSIRSGINKNVKKGIKGKLKKFVKPEKITDMAMKRIANKDGKVDLKYKVTGTMSKPVTKLVHPKLPSLKSLIKGSAGDLKGKLTGKLGKGKEAAKEALKKAKDAAIKKAKEAAKKKAEEEAKKKAKDKLKKLF